MAVYGIPLGPISSAFFFRAGAARVVALPFFFPFPLELAHISRIWENSSSDSSPVSGSPLAAAGESTGSSSSTSSSRLLSNIPVSPRSIRLAFS